MKISPKNQLSVLFHFIQSLLFFSFYSKQKLYSKGLPIK